MELKAMPISFCATVQYFKIVLQDDTTVTGL